MFRIMSFRIMTSSLLDAIKKKVFLRERIINMFESRGSPY